MRAESFKYSLLSVNVDECHLYGVPHDVCYMTYHLSHKLK